MNRILIAILALWWISWHVIPTAGFPRLILEPRSRYEHVRLIKPAIEAVVWFNTQIEVGKIPADVVVYGYWLEDLRYYADFKWIGSIYGYADHYDFVEAARSGVPELREWLNFYDVDYVVWDDGRAERGEPYYGEFAMPVYDPDWSLYFERVPVEWESEMIEVWQVK